MFNELVDYVTKDVHPFMEALSLVTRAVNDNAFNDNTATDAEALPLNASLTDALAS